VVDTASMSPERWHHISEIAADCLAIEDAELREQHLLKACADDAALALAVRDVLQQDAAQGNPLQRTAMLHAAAQSMGAQTALAGARLGPWQLDAEIARGGMGTVYRAHRADGEYAQDVAIKLVRADVNSQQVVDRFHAERQILASLAHPNIARLIDGGTRAEGTPYLVMEYVDGESIIAYATRHQLDIAERLQLFRTVCAAVHFAHQRLVVHRDLKPSNIFVTHAGEVKLLDFGIAKVLESAPAVDGPAQTTMLAMTPAYASPEQVKGETVTTASDVYALGVVLYELLTGQSPYKSKTTQPLALAKEIVDTEPERPSQVAERADDNTPALKKLRTGLRAELDNIVLMALRKEPARRYSSAEQLASDITRYLGGLPVLAHTDSWRYRAGKFVARNRVLFGVSSLAVVGLLAVTAFALWQASEARVARAAAERSAQESRSLANDSLFELHTMIEDLPGSEPARKHLVEKAVAQLERLDSQAEPTAASLRDAGWGWYRLAELQGGFAGRNVGQNALAKQNYSRALAALERSLALSPQDIDTATRATFVHRAFGVFLGVHGESKLSMRQYDEGVRVASALIDDTPKTQKLRLALAGTLYYRATRGDWRDDQIQSRIDEADRARQILEQLSSESIESAIIREDVAAAFAATLGGLSDLEAKRIGTTGHVAALGWARKVLALQDARVANDPNNARIKYNASGANGTLTSLLLDLGRADEALPYAKRGVELLREVAAASPKDNSAAINLLFRLYALATAQLEAKLLNEATASHDEFMRRWDAMPSHSREIQFAVLVREMERGVASRLSARASQSPSSSASERVKNCNAAIEQASMLRRYAIANPSRVTSPVPGGDPLQDVLTDLKRCSMVVVVPTI
jgi:eukaryotic-like serine/threonine-protein kinase